MNLLTSSYTLRLLLAPGCIQFCEGEGFLEAEEIVRVGTTGKSQGLFLKCVGVTEVNCYERCRGH